MLPTLSTRLHLAPCPACGHRVLARSWEAVEAALTDHVVAVHNARVLPNERQ